MYDFSEGSEKIYNKDTNTIVNSIQKVVELKVKSVESLINYTQLDINSDNISENYINNKLIYMYEEAKNSVDGVFVTDVYNEPS